MEETKAREIEEDLEDADEVSQHEEADIEATTGDLERFTFTPDAIFHQTPLFQHAMSSMLILLNLFEEGTLFLTQLMQKLAVDSCPIPKFVNTDILWIELQKYIQNRIGVTDVAVPADRADSLIADFRACVQGSDDSLGYFRLGVAQWHCGGAARDDKTQCVAALLTAAKLDPEYAPTFTYLGHYYCLSANNQDRGRKCYLKSVKLDGLERAAGDAMVGIYINEAQMDVCVQFLQEVIHDNEHGHWPYAALGRIYMFVDADQSSSDDTNFRQAEDNLQEALRLIPDDATTWELLGSCYLRGRKFYPALKAYLEVLRKELLVCS